MKFESDACTLHRRDVKRVPVLVIPWLSNETSWIIGIPLHPAATQRGTVTYAGQIEGGKAEFELETLTEWAICKYWTSVVDREIP